MRRLILALSLLAGAACKGPPSRLVAGTADTVIVNNQRPVQLPIRVLDAAGHRLDSTGVRYEWMAGEPVSVSATGVVTCAQAGDATVRASLGEVSTNVLLRCRPVREVRAMGMMNLVVGGPAQELAFEALDVDERPVTMITGEVTVEDSTIVTVEGTRVRARAPGSTGLTMRVGDRQAYAAVHTYELVRTPEGIRPDQHVAVRVRLAGNEMRRWRIFAPRSVNFVTMIPDSDEQQMPRLSFVGASCRPNPLSPHSYICSAQHDASVIVYHPQDVDPAEVLSGTLAVWRQGSY
jgi:hypothetical protein